MGVTRHREKIDEARLLPRFQRARLKFQQAGILRDAILQAESEGRVVDMPRPNVTPAGDPIRMRGLPMIGPGGIGDAIPATKPEQALLRKQREV
jgi:hypothetical protein